MQRIDICGALESFVNRGTLFLHSHTSIKKILSPFNSILKVILNVASFQIFKKDLFNYRDGERHAEKVFNLLFPDGCNSLAKPAARASFGFPRWMQGPNDWGNISVLFHAH